MIPFSAPFSTLRAALCLGTVALLAACSPSPDVACPPVTVLPELAQMEVKSTDGKNTVLARAEIEGYRKSCNYNEKTVDVTLQFKLRVTKEAGYDGTPLNLSYFAAVPAFYPSDQAKAVLPLRIVLQEDTPSQDIIDNEVVLTLPLGESRSGTELEVFAGFQLTPDQIDRLWGNKTKPVEHKVPKKVPRR